MFFISGYDINVFGKFIAFFKNFILIIHASITIDLK